MATTLVHCTGFAFMSFFFRYRRLGLAPTLLISAGYYNAFETINNAMYKLIVDKPVLSAARSCGLDEHAQPVGSVKVRNITFK